ncbi:MAG: hypothetical protein AVDCRST_MAG50-2948 [uncultured Acidimicrobiales bacterium]|uniref:Uncharacterized protein n=1 Tax=uncultured Acidimicrobiales bacterium TaxID=310071 RepID=A0A6J4IT34_9ACTN|nr:MAG: hypothetical protein AVDCRST_MAG50-2948 [uncultured Acidimicrobiales bacterium]
MVNWSTPASYGIIRTLEFHGLIFAAGDEKWGITGLGVMVASRLEAATPE